MSRTLIALLVVSSSGALVLSAHGAPSQVRVDERVRLVDSSPVTLRGLRFAPAEKVRVTVTLGERQSSRIARAGARGGFDIAFPAFHYDRCHGALAVRAVGSRGSRTSWTIVPLECPIRSDD